MSQVTGEWWAPPLCASLNVRANTEIISEDRLLQVHSTAAGIYKSYVKTGDEVRKGDLLCEIIDPLEGVVISKVLAPADGIVFFRYNRPLEFEKTVLYKIIII